MKPAVSWHTTLPSGSPCSLLHGVGAKSSVLYLWRPWVAERGCSGQEQALSVSHRTGGFGAPRAEIQDLPGTKSACSGVGGVAKWRGEAQGRLAMERHHRGSQRDIKPRPAAATLLLVFLFVVCFTRRAAEIFIIALCKECFHAVPAQPQTGSFIRQHEAEHHLNCQQQGMKIPNNGGRSHNSMW